jgi:hypothetical protein
MREEVSRLHNRTGKDPETRVCFEGILGKARRLAWLEQSEQGNR